MGIPLNCCMLSAYDITRVINITIAGQSHLVRRSQTDEIPKELTQLSVIIWRQFLRDAVLQSCFPACCRDSHCFQWNEALNKLYTSHLLIDNCCLNWTLYRINTINAYKNSNTQTKTYYHIAFGMLWLSQIYVVWFSSWFCTHRQKLFVIPYYLKLRNIWVHTTPISSCEPISHSKINI